MTHCSLPVLRKHFNDISDNRQQIFIETVFNFEDGIYKQYLQTMQNISP